MASINLDGFGYNEVEATAIDKTLDVADSGVVQNVTATKTITLPAVATAKVGTTYIVRVGAEGINVTIDLDNSDKIMGNGFTASDGKYIVATSQPAGSFVQLVSDGVDGFCVQRVLGTWTRE